MNANKNQIKMVKLGEVCNINPRFVNNINDDSLVSFVPMAGVSEDGYLLFEESRQLKDVKKGYRNFLRGDVLLAKITPCMENGKACHVNFLKTEIGFGSTEFHVLRSTNQVNAKYLFYMIWNDFFRSDAKKNMTGAGGQKRVPTPFLKSYEIPLPPLPEQKRIAEILGLADEARCKRRENLTLYDDLIRSFFLKTFGDPVSNPMGWDVKEVGEIAEVSTGKTPSRARPEYYEGDVPWVKTTEVDGALILETSECISEKAVVQCSMKIFPVNSILIAMYGQGKTRGQSARLGISATTNQACGVILPSKDYCTGYLETYLQINYEAIRELGRGGNQPNLNLSLVRNINVLYPSLDLQEKFAIQVKEINAQKAREQALYEQHDDLFNALLQRAFKGEL